MILVEKVLLMRFRKSMAAMVLCATGAGASLMGAGTALAWHNEVLGEYGTFENCSKHLDEVVSRPDVGGAECAPDGQMVGSVR